MPYSLVNFWDILLTLSPKTFLMTFSLKPMKCYGTWPATQSNAADQRTGLKKLGKQGRTLLLRKLLSLSGVFMGRLFLCSRWAVKPAEAQTIRKEELAPSQSAGIFLKRSHPAAKFGQFNIYTGQQVMGLVWEGNKQQYAKRRTIWIIIHLFRVGGSGAESKGIYHRLFHDVFLFLFFLFFPK